MLGDSELEPAHDYLSELGRTIPLWREKFVNEATVSGRAVFQAELFADDKIWSECVALWGAGPGYRDAVATQLENWCDNHAHLQAAVEKRVHAIWRDAFLLPLALLCASTDLLSTANQEVPKAK